MFIFFAPFLFVVCAYYAFPTPIQFDYNEGERYENNIIHNIDNNKNMEIQNYEPISIIIIGLSLMHLKLLLTSAVCGAKVDDDAKIFMATTTPIVAVTIVVVVVIVAIVKKTFHSPLTLCFKQNRFNEF